MKTEWRRTAWVIRDKTGRVASSSDPKAKGLPGLYDTERDAAFDMVRADSKIERVEIIVRRLEAE